MPKKSLDEFVPVYAAVGGTPAYLLQFNPLRDFWHNVRYRILEKEAYLYSEPEFILRAELREPRNYFAILRSISMGKTRPSEIINETGFEKNLVGKYLSVLTELRIIRREAPVTEKSFAKSKRGIYVMDDPFFRFWFSFVFPNKSFIEEGKEDYIIQNKIKPGFEIFTSFVFEDICRSFIGKGGWKGLEFNKVGRWWSREGEIDVVAVNEQENAILFGEAKWSSKKVGTDILMELKRKPRWWNGAGKTGRNIMPCSAEKDSRTC